MTKKKMKIRAWVEDNKATVKAIIFHPMETGMRKDKATGKPIPAHYITEVQCKHNGQLVLTCYWGPGVSKNPFISFKFDGAKSADTLKVSWLDNQGHKGEKEAKIN